MGRFLLGLLGLLGMGYGARLLLDLGPADLLDALVWMGAAIVAHDVVLAPLVVASGAGLGYVLPSVARAPVLVGLVVLGTVTVVAVPVLGRFGASPGNETLLDRDYVGGWFLLAGLTVAGMVGAILVRRAHGGRSVGSRD